MLRELANILHRNSNDPRLELITLTAVKISKDLRHAKVFFTTALKVSDEEVKESVKALKKAAGFLRHELAHTSTMRTIPALRFVYDESIERGRTLEELIEYAVEQDAETDVKDPLDKME